MADRRPLIAGNWKMNGLRADGLALAGTLAEKLRATGSVGFDLLVCPPATLIWPVAAVLGGSGVLLGGQDCHEQAAGAFTGDIAPGMLAEAGCRYVILGHSERRAGHGETSAMVMAKALAAHAAGLTTIICVGETAEERDSGKADAVVTEQLVGSIPVDADDVTTVIAYEPVWAIGTGKTATVEDVVAMHGVIRRLARERFGETADRLRILYGGSVKPANAASLLRLPHVDGALVGGASLDAEAFWAIATAAA